MGVEILYLVAQNQRLMAMVNDPQHAIQTLQTGDRVPNVRTSDINGNEISLHYDADQPYTVLFWFSPSCESCEENLDFWNDLYSKYASDNIRFVGICASTVTEAKEAATEHGMQFSVVCATDPFIVDAYKGNVLPQTLLIDPDGSINKVWPGSLLKGQKEEILSVLETL